MYVESIRIFIYWTLFLFASFCLRQSNWCKYVNTNVKRNLIGSPTYVASDDWKQTWRRPVKTATFALRYQIEEDGKAWSFSLFWHLHGLQGLALDCLLSLDLKVLFMNLTLGELRWQAAMTLWLSLHTTYLIIFILTHLVRGKYDNVN